MLKIAVYGKGGIGKSTFSSNLSAAFGRLGRKTIQVGCDPKHDSTFTLTGNLIPTVVEVLSSHKFKTDEIERDEIVFNGKYGVDCVEAGGPPAGAGCGGYVVGETVKLLEKFGVYKDYEVQVFDVLGDVVCGGFSAPLQHSEQVIIVATNDFDSIFAANRIATAITIKQKSGGGALAGIVANRASHTELVGPFAERIGTVCLTTIPEHDSVRKSRLTARTVFEIDPTGELGAPWMELAQRMLDGVPCTIPTPIPERELFGLLGGDYVHTGPVAVGIAVKPLTSYMFDAGAEVIERDDFCSLAPIGWLHHKMQDSFFLVVGTGSCQGFLQTALGVMIFARPRFATAMLDEDDLAGADPLTALRPLVKTVVEEHAPRAIFLGSTCTPEILKMNIAGCAAPLEREFGVRVYPARMDGFDASYTEGEDHVLMSMIERAPDGPGRNLVILGCLSAMEEAEIRLECAQMGLPVPSFLPGESALDLPVIGKETVLVPAHPYLFAACQYAKRERGCEIPTLPFPYGPDGTRGFYEGIARAFGREVSYEAREAAAWRACERETAPLRGRSIAFYSDALLELPLARTLRAAGATIPFISTPRVYRKFHAAESATLGDVEILEAPDRFDAFERLSQHRPDLVVANLNVANSLEGMGFNVKWSTELTFQPIRGFSGASTLFRMFATAMSRHDALAQGRAAAGSAEHPIDLEFFRRDRDREPAQTA